MNEPALMEGARMWLTNEVHERRRLDLLVAFGMLIGSGASVAFGVWLIGPPITAGVLLLMGIVYLVYGHFRTEPPMISAETARPRTLGVVRNPMLTRNAYEQTHVDFTYAIGFLMAPIHLVVEAARTFRRQSRLGELDCESVAEVLAMLAERRSAIPLPDVMRNFPRGEATIELLRQMRGVVVLRDPDRISLTDTVVDEIRAA